MDTTESPLRDWREHLSPRPKNFDVVRILKEAFESHPEFDDVNIDNGFVVQFWSAERSWKLVFEPELLERLDDTDGKHEWSLRVDLNRSDCSRVEELPQIMGWSMALIANGTPMRSITIGNSKIWCRDLQTLEIVRAKSDQIKELERKRKRLMKEIGCRP